jgi:hypothetical protein
MDDHWLILRTSSRATIALADCLLRDGYEAWTPVHTFMKRAPRRRELNEVVVPMLPSFAFARAQHIHSLLALAESFSKPCPDFSVFHYMNNVPLVSDGELSSLRNLEESCRQRAAVEKRKSNRREILFRAGDAIRINGGAFAGMDGVVENDDGKFAMVSFGGTKVKIATFLLANDNIPIPQRA